MSIDILIEVAREELIKDTIELPSKGEIWYDENGKIICHVCGRSFNKLSSHLVQAHNISSSEYKEMFELNRGQKLTSKSMEEYFRNKPRKDITKYSMETRFKDKHKSPRKGKKARLQTILENPIKYKKKNKDYQCNDNKIKK